MIAALFVGDQPGDPYTNIPDVEVWGLSKDARNYNGPHSVVAHPPCERWGRYWSGGPKVKVKRTLGDDGGCFAHALHCVRTFGGVLEHPEASHAFSFFGLKKPPRSGGWIQADEFGLCCCVEQGHYGHRARKATWLYVVGCTPPELTWGPAEGIRLEAGYHTAEERAQAKRDGVYRTGNVLSKRERWATPDPFRDLLLDIARSVII